MISLSEAAAQLGVTKAWLARLCRAGRVTPKPKQLNNGTWILADKITIKPSKKRHGERGPDKAPRSNGRWA